MKYKSSDGSSSQYLNLKNNPYPTKSISNLHTNIQNLYVFPFYIYARLKFVSKKIHRRFIVFNRIILNECNFFGFPDLRKHHH